MTNKSKIDLIKEYVAMVIGCVFYALSIVLFLAPNEIVAGGITGLSTLIHIINEAVPIGMISIALNLPIFLMGLKQSGWRFIFKSLLTVSVLGVATDLLSFLGALTLDPLLASLYGGICQGIGIGLFLRFEYSSGGTELLGRVLSKWTNILNIPTWVGICDAVIVLAGAIVLGKVENVLYALIVIVVSTKLSEIILTGIDKSKLCIIISDKGQEIADTLIKSSPRGVTMLDGEGMYTHSSHKVLLTCVKNRQLTQLRQIVKSIDEHAFVIINDSVEVRGQGFTNWNKDV